jgi:two-component system response regulator AtoC
MTDTLLVIEDEDLLGNELLRHYRSQGWEAVRASTLAEARRMLIDQELDPLVVLSDMNLPDGSALDLLETVRRTAPGGEWILLTGFGSVPDSVRALRLGAYDFLEKPCPTDGLGAQRPGATPPAGRDGVTPSAVHAFLVRRPERRGARSARDARPACRHGDQRARDRG